MPTTPSLPASRPAGRCALDHEMPQHPDNTKVLLVELVLRIRNRFRVSDLMSMSLEIQEKRNVDSGIGIEPMIIRVEQS